MKISRNINGFTLIELMVVIAIIWILFAGSKGLNFNKISDQQKLTLFNQQIISQFEKIRNNTLLWKWIDANIWVPDSWMLEYSNTWSWQIDVQYLSGSTWLPYSSDSITTSEFYEISNINCEDLSWSNAWSWTSEVIIRWNNLTLSWSCNTSARILKFDTRFRAFSSSFKINTLNWLIEQN